MDFELLTFLQLIITILILLFTLYISSSSKDQSLFKGYNIINRLTSLSYENVIIISIFIVLTLFCTQLTNSSLTIFKGTTEPVIIISLTIILIDATLSLLSFTYYLVEKDIESKIESYLGSEKKEQLVHKSPNDIKKALFDCFDKFMNKFTKLEEETNENRKEFNELKNENTSIADERKKIGFEFTALEEKKDDRGYYNINIERLESKKKALKKRCEKIKEKLQIVEKKTEELNKRIQDMMDKEVGITLLFELYRSKQIKISGEFFFMSTALLIIGTLFLGIFLAVMNYSNIFSLNDLFYQIPIYLLYSYSLGWIILALLIFFKGIRSFLQCFNNIGILEDLKASELAEVRSNILDRKADLKEIVQE